MKTRDTAGTPPRKKPQSQGLGPVSKAVATGMVCTTLACTGPQVRPDPPPEECPPGALEAMAELGIRVGAEGPATLPGEIRAYISVHEGATSMEVLGIGGLRQGAILRGRLLFGSKRVYGRFTEAQKYQDTRTWPVCLDMVDSSYNHGVELEPGSTNDTARIFNAGGVRAVNRFQ